MAQISTVKIMYPTSEAKPRFYAISCVLCVTLKLNSNRSPIPEISRESKSNKFHNHLQHEDTGEKVICNLHEHFKWLQKANIKDYNY